MIGAAQIEVGVQVNDLGGAYRAVEAAVRAEGSLVPAAEDDGEGAGFDELLHLIGERIVGAVEVVGLGGDRAGVGKRMLMVHRQGTQRGTQRGRACGCTLAAAIAQHALIGGKAQEGYRGGGVGGLIDNAMPTGMLWARAIGATGPFGGGGEKFSFFGVHGYRG